MTQWRAQSQADINFGYDLMPVELRATVKVALVREQRGLCAYTGIGIDSNNSHIEHLTPQEHCQNGEDVSYANLVACYPSPNSGYVAYGAHKKANWPSPDERHLFVSPRSQGCEDRFAFNLRGEMAAANDCDGAAKVTIQKLGLNHQGLQARRQAAINATLEFRGKKTASLDLKLAKRRLGGLVQAEAGSQELEPFCFVLKQALGKHIKRLEGIKESKQRKK
ncbi:MAG: TIGR02646 family protein [Gemmataceae bacterium]|nr:TIGR02646 family protein [Gemmataceae bacterium]